MPSQERVTLFLEGLTDLEGAKNVYLDEGSVNFYPTQDGYIQNYPGSVDYFDRTVYDPQIVTGIGTPPALGNMTRVFSFVDALSIEHLIVVSGANLIEIEGNGFKTLYTFTGRNYNGLYYPSFFIHNSRVVIFNEDDQPLIWDGIDGIEPLGVQEVPNPPVNVYTVDPYKYNALAGAADNVYNNGEANWQFAASRIQLGPGLRKNVATDPIEGWYSTVVQFIDKNGNRGRASAASSIFCCEHEHPAPNDYIFRGMLTEWIPPRSDYHIHYVAQGRTLTLNHEDSAPLGQESIFYEEVLLEGTTQHRRVQRLTDDTLALQSLIDLSVGPPPSFVKGCSFGGRIYGVTKENIIYYSDLTFFGQYRETQIIRPYSNLTVFVPAGDRVFFIGTTSTEVYFESNAGPALLEQDINNGSRHGNTFIAVGDGLVFGLWNKGFGFFDGKEHKYVDEPEYIRTFYVDSNNTSHSAKKVGDLYYVMIRKDHVTENNNTLLIYNMRSNRWYIIEDTFFDIHEWNGEILGAKDSLYVLFRGSTFPISRVKTSGIVSSEINQERNLIDLRLLVDPGALSTMNISIVAETQQEHAGGAGVKMYPHEHANKRYQKPSPYWSQPFLNYGVEWVSPSDQWLTVEFDNPVAGMYHKIDMTFEAGKPVRLKAMQLGYGNPIKAEHV